VLPWLEKGCSVIALPHNIESIYDGASHRHFGKQGVSRAFFTEVGWLKQTRAVLTISETETWILRNLGVNAHTLPYWPPSEIMRRCAEIRSSRNPAGNKVLLVGTAHNPATREGMEDFIKDYIKVAVENSPRVIVAGWGTEKLRCFECGKVRVLGGCPAEVLKAEMQTVNAAVVLQKRGVGALTRIPELLLCGIPIITTEFSARGYSYLWNCMRLATEETIAWKVAAMIDPPPPPENAAALIEAAKEEGMALIGRVLGESV
jgi:hypothetical protein